MRRFRGVLSPIATLLLASLIVSRLAPPTRSENPDAEPRELEAAPGTGPGRVEVARRTMPQDRERSPARTV